MTSPDPLMDGAVNVPHEPPRAPETSWGFDSAGIHDNFQPSDGAAIDRHIIQVISTIEPPNFVRGKRIKSLAERFWEKVDTSGDCWLWTASLDSNGYGKIGAGGDRGRTLCAHRVAWELARGSVPDEMEIDHICRVRKCVRVEHMRIVTRKQQNENRRDRQGSQLPRGVRLHHTGKYEARCKHNHRHLTAGLYLTVEDAAEAARQLRNRVFTHNDDDRREAI